MKKTIFTILFISITILSISQKKINVGLHFAENSTWLINDYVYISGPIMRVDPSFGNYFGVVGEYEFTDILGVELNMNFNKIVQKYNGDLSIFNIINEEITSENKYKSYTKLNTLDIPILFKVGNKIYFEIGPLFQFVNKVTYGINWNNSGNVETSNNELKNSFNKAGMGASVGFGCNIGIIPDKLYANIGFRFNYVFTNMVGIDALGNSFKDVKKNGFETFPLYGGIKLGLIYRINLD